MDNNWFKKWFNSKFYLEIYSHRNSEDARNLINLIQRTLPLESGDRVLDICCGAGRHSIEFARRGFDVTGFDLSPYLIRRAKADLKILKEKNIRAGFLICDMRNFNFRNSFDLSLNLFSSFGYFNNDEENFSVFRNANSSLKNGGYFVFDFLNEKFLRQNVIKSSRNKIGKYTVSQFRKIEDDFVIKKIVISEAGKNTEFSERLKLYNFKQIKGALESSGFKVLKTSGDYFGNKFVNNSSERIIIFAKKI